MAVRIDTIDSQEILTYHDKSKKYLLVKPVEFVYRFDGSEYTILTDSGHTVITGIQSLEDMESTIRRLNSILWLK